jgi:hypothetical protein
MDVQPGQRVSSGRIPAEGQLARLPEPELLDKSLRILHSALNPQCARQQVEQGKGNANDGDREQPKVKPTPHELVSNDLGHADLL